jgi:hypothetical protein
MNLAPGWRVLASHEATARLHKEGSDWCLDIGVMDAIGRGDVVAIVSGEDKMWLCGPHEAESLSLGTHPEAAA